MNRTFTGCAIIFNFEEFQSKKFEKREGSQADVKRLEDVFYKLNIDIRDRIYNNLTYNSMRQRLKDCKYRIVKSSIILCFNQKRNHFVIFSFINGNFVIEQ